MKKQDIIRAWGSILCGRRPLLSLEITRECPLRCSGCYAYDLEHLGNAGPLRELADYQGEQLINGVLALVRRLRPLHISIVGGEPLVRFRELDVLIPKLGDMDVEVQLVTSAVRPIPGHWSKFSNLHMVVSVDGLQEEHDIRRAPATYDRILKHIAGHRIVVHCTVTRQQARRPGYLAEFARLWSEREEVRKIWFSLFTPQRGQQSEERLTQADRIAVVREIAGMMHLFPKVDVPRGVLEGYLNPPRSPQECVFAQVTDCVSADLRTRIEPCQFGGQPDCSECGCMASAGFASIARYKLAGIIPVSALFAASQSIGARLNGGSPATPIGEVDEVRVA
ncbi:MAG: radical SAM protein [Acidobacteria bacterium]|nr:radical SAM protein [Acidobacteriota bacterium]